MHVRMRLTLPRDARCVAVMRNVATCLLTDLGTPAPERDDIALALTEACTNAVKHAVGTAEYTVGFELGTDYCEIEVRDCGPGLGDQLDQAAPGGALDSVLERGRGLVLMQALMDDSELICREDSTTVKLVKRFNSMTLRPLEPAAPRR